MIDVDKIIKRIKKGKFRVTKVIEVFAPEDSP